MRHKRPLLENWWGNNVCCSLYHCPESEPGRIKTGVKKKKKEIFFPQRLWEGRKKFKVRRFQHKTFIGLSPSSKWKKVCFLCRMTLSVAHWNDFRTVNMQRREVWYWALVTKTQIVAVVVGVGCWFLTVQPKISKCHSAWDSGTSMT